MVYHRKLTQNRTALLKHRITTIRGVYRFVTISVRFELLAMRLISVFGT